MTQQQQQQEQEQGKTWERYSRQMLFRPIGAEGQAKLGDATVLIAGMGALGTVLANHMVRSGVGTVRMADRDYVERSNLQRQMLYDEDDVAAGYPKAVAAERKLARINPDVRLEPIVTDITAANVEALVKGAHLVLDGTDNFRTRLLLNDACFKLGVPFVYGGAVSSQGMSAVFVPGETSCLRCLFGSEPAGAGQTCDTIGVISPIVDIVASFQAAEAVKLLVGSGAARRRTLLTIDLWGNQMFEVRLPEPRSDCPTCGLKRYPALDLEESDTVTLCGRETVQIRASKPLDLQQLEAKLAPVCRIERNPFLLKAALPEGERLVLFPDGRTLVQGTEDMVRARSLYDRYIGS